MQERYEFRDDKSSKFWEVSVDGSSVTTNWGRIGTNGQSKTKDYPDANKALAEAKKAAEGKANKGYVRADEATDVDTKVKASTRPKQSTSGKAKQSATQAVVKSVTATASAKAATAPQDAAAALKNAKQVPAPSAAAAEKTAVARASVSSAEIAVDVSDLGDDIFEGWGYGQKSVPPLPSWDLAELRKELEGKLKMDDLANYKPGDALASKEYDTWQFSGVLKGATALTDELWGFVRGKTDELSEDGQVGLLHYGQSWYGPPVEVMRYHLVRFGALALLKSICRFARYHYDYDSYTLLERGDYRYDFEHACTDISLRVFELRHAIALFSESQWREARDFVVSEWEDIDTMLRPAVAYALNDAELAASALETAPGEHWFYNEYFNCGVAAADPDVGARFVKQVPRSFLPFAPGYLRQYGLRALPILKTIATGFKLKGDAAGDATVCKALAATPHVETMCASLGYLHYKGDCQKFIRAQFEKRPKLGGDAVRMALESNDPALRASARSLAALTDAKDSLLPDGVAASEGDLPRFLATPPWAGKKKGLKHKAATVEPLAHDESFPCRTGAKVEGDGNPWPKTANAVIERLVTQTYWSARPFADSLLLLTDAQFEEHAIPNASRVQLGAWHQHTDDFSPVLHRFGPQRTLAFLLNRSPAESVPHLDQADVPAVAPRMAEAFSKKTLKAAARRWFDSFPEAAAIGLAPELFVKAKKRVGLATVALCRLSALGHKQVVLDVAARYGGDVEKAMKQIAELEDIDIVPAKIPKLEGYFSLVSLDPPRLRKSGAYLGEDALENFCTMLAFSNYDDEYVGIGMAEELFTPESLEAFAHSAFETWLTQGAAGASNWAMLALGWFAGDDAVRRLTPLIRKWPGEGGAKRAQLGLDVLAKIGTDAALSNVFSISQKLKYKSVQARAEEVVQEIAASLELTTDELGDRVVPDFGLDEDGTTWIDYGSRRFHVRLDESLAPILFDQEGKRLKSIPKPGKNDVAETAKEEKKRFSALKKDLKSVAKQQTQRLELAMCHRRQWSAEAFQQYFIDHPLVVNLVRRLVFQAGDTLFTVDESRQPIDAEFEPVILDGEVWIPHPLDLDETTMATWGEYFADHELIQPFEQLARGVYAAKDYTINKAGAVVDFGIEVPAPKWVYGIEKRGWSRWDISDGGGFYSHERLGPDGWSAVINFEGAVAVGYIEEKETVTVTDLVFSKQGNEVAANKVDPRFASEVLRDVEAARP